MSKIKKVFLGGTCNNSKWRSDLIPLLEENNIDYFNPVVEDWTPECMQEELRQRNMCDICLYTISSEMKGVYSIAEVIDDSNKNPEKTFFCVIPEGFDDQQKRSLNNVGKMVVRNGGVYEEGLNNILAHIV